MARRRGATKLTLRQDELIDDLIPDPSQHEPVTALSGFLGKSTQAGHWRLYLTPELDQYVEIPEDAILRTKPSPASGPTLAGSIVWIRASTPLVYKRISTIQIQAEFLQGRLLANVRPGEFALPSAMFSGIHRQARYNSIDVCPSDRCSVDVCSMANTCHRPTIGINCTAVNYCADTLACSLGSICGSAIGCPSVGAACNSIGCP